MSLGCYYYLMMSLKMTVNYDLHILRDKIINVR